MIRHKTRAPAPQGHPQIALFDAATALGFQATNSDDVMVAGAKAKAWANLEAVRLLYALEAADKLPTPAEQAVLARYSAFGGFPKAFDDHPANPERAIHEATKSILTPADYKAAKQSTPNAFYTSPEIIGAIWQYLAHLGFRGGRVLEPAAATGLFLAGMPQALRRASTLTAVELDRVSGRMGQLLHPDAEYHIAGLQAVDLMRGTFDLITSNIPFGEYPVFDASFSAAEVLLSKSIHNYFFIKAVQLARPGGLIAFVTSRYMLDAKNDAVRAYLAARCRLVGAVRLPSYAFRQFSGTDVVTDLVVLKKLDEGENAPTDPGWLGVNKVMLAGAKLLKEEFWINEYFTRQPERIMGELRCRTGAYAAQLTVAGAVDPEGLAERIVAALPAYSAPVYHVATALAPLGLSARSVPFTDVRDGSYAYMVVGGVMTVYQKRGGAAVPVAHKGRKLDRLIGQIDLVTLARAVVDQCLHGDDADLATAQAHLNAAYDHFVADFGYLSEKANRGLFAGDPNATFLLALELYDATRNVAHKTRLFTERTVRGHQRPTHAGSAADALALSLNEYGSLNMAYMVELYGRDEDAIIAELGEAIFFDPALGAWVTSDEYLSGNVRDKLRAVEDANDPDLDRNHAALTAVQPTPLLPEQITAALGATWIPEYVVSQFAVELVDRYSLANHIDEPGYRTTHYGGTHHERYFRVKARYVPALARWEVKPSNTQRHNDLATRTWGTERRGVFDLLEAKLNGSEISVYDKDGDETIFNATETIAAREKANAIAKLFARWVWMHPARRDDLAARYNEKFRCLVERTFDGSYLTFPNTSLDLPPFHAHQRNGIARGLRGGNTLLWHAVGAGKSWSMIVMAMEMKRLGLRHKPIHVVPGHLLEQYATEFYRVYPAARILVIDSEKMSPRERDVSLARIATEDWDSILITHSAFQRIPLQIKTWEWLVETQVAELDESMAAMKDDEDRKYTVKRMEAKKLALQARLEERRSRAAKNKTGLTFEELGIDMILADEFHTYKSLYFGTMRGHIAGLGGSDAGIAYDMFIKSQYVTRRCTAGHILGERRTECQCGAPRAKAGSLIGATGTAITNSISEMYTLMRYFQMDDLIAVGLDAFDAWASQFGDTKWVVEMEASGRGWRTKERFIEFFNVPELLLIFRQVADICIDQAVLRLARPSLAGGSPKPVAIQPSSALLAFIDKCAARAEALDGKKPWEDNMLAIMGDSGRAATDVRLVDIKIDAPGSKINTVVDNVFRIWQETSHVTLPGLDAPVGLTQLVFLDVGVPGGAGYPLYADMKAKWVARGVPAAEIAFAHDAKTDAEKKELYNNVNAGRVRIVLGTTAKLGAGVNIQRLMYALHHVDAPWTPALMEQREGRIWRPGNLNDVVVIYRYTVEKTLDFHRWHLLELKAAANLQLLTSGDGARRVGDLDQAVISFAEMRALATGNPLVVEQVHLRADLNVLYALHSKFMEQHRQLRLDVANIPGAIRWHEEQIERFEAAVAYRGRWTEKPNLVVQGRAYAKRSEAAEHFQSLINNALYNTLVLHMGYAEVSIFRGTGKRVYARIHVDKLTLDAELGDSGIGNLTRIENEIDDMPKVVQYHRQWIANEQDRLARLEAELATFTFDREGEMQTKEARLHEIDGELASLASHDHIEAPAAETEANADDE